MIQNDQRFEHLLSCGCRTKTPFPVETGGEQICSQHGFVRKVRNVQWSICCIRCRFSRHSLGALTAQVRAEGHTQRTGHPVRITCMCEGVITLEWETLERQLDIGDVPPF